MYYMCNASVSIKLPCKIHVILFLYELTIKTNEDTKQTSLVIMPLAKDVDLQSVLMLMSNPLVFLHSLADNQIHTSFLH